MQKEPDANKMHKYIARKKTYSDLTTLAESDTYDSEMFGPGAVARLRECKQLTTSITVTQLTF